MITLTKEKLEKLAAIYENLESLNRSSSDAINAAKEEGKGTVLLIKRNDGKEVEVTEKELWEEIRFIGEASEGYAVMKRRYPKAFELGEAQRKQAQELNTYCLTELGVGATAMRLIDIINIVIAVLDMRAAGKK